MITVQLPLRRTKRIKAFHRWFYDKPLKRDALMLTYYYHCKYTGKVKGFKREAKYTKLLDLTQTDDEILAGCNKTTRYHIRRAESKDNLTFGFVEDWEVFRDYYNEFAAQKELGDVDDSILSSYWEYCHVTKVEHEGQPMVMHAYLVDEEASRVNLTYSAAHFRGMEDKEMRALNGRANRWLHFKDMMYFKEMGIRCFDFGGYAYQTEDPGMQAINTFKDGFGGEMVEESNYSSRGIVMLRRLKSVINARRAKRKRADKK